MHTILLLIELTILLFGRRKRIRYALTCVSFSSFFLQTHSTRLLRSYEFLENLHLFPNFLSIARSVSESHYDIVKLIPTMWPYLLDWNLKNSNLLYGIHLRRDNQPTEQIAFHQL